MIRRKKSLLPWKHTGDDFLSMIMRQEMEERTGEKRGEGRIQGQIGGKIPFSRQVSDRNRFGIQKENLDGNPNFLPISPVTSSLLSSLLSCLFVSFS